MKLEAGKKYVLSNGRVEKCLAVWCEAVGGYQATVTCGAGARDYTLDGRFIAHIKECENDIIAEYKEPTRVADYLVEARPTRLVPYYVKETHPIGQQPEGSVMVPGSEKLLDE